MTSCSSKVIKNQNGKDSLNAFGFEEFETVSILSRTWKKWELRIPKEIQDIIQEKLSAIEQREAVIEKEAYEKGFAQGQLDGEKVGKKSIDIIESQLSGLLRNLQSLSTEILTFYEGKISALILGLAEAIVQKEVKHNEKIVRKTLKLALAEIEEAQRINIRINPKDFELIQENLPGIATGNQGEDYRITWKPDVRVGRGGCILETDEQIIDATIEGRINAFRKILQNGNIL